MKRSSESPCPFFQEGEELDVPLRPPDRARHEIEDAHPFLGQAEKKPGDDPDDEIPVLDDSVERGRRILQFELRLDEGDQVGVSCKVEDVRRRFADRAEGEVAH
ncbi:MAG: hypothetical protein GX911_02125, partial [Spirochaetales bacterium]|nr:hypothetical protein [Spirochaetales bacterium]